MLKNVKMRFMRQDKRDSENNTSTVIVAFVRNELKIRIKKPSLLFKAKLRGGPNKLQSLNNALCFYSFFWPIISVGSKTWKSQSDSFGRMTVMQAPLPLLIENHFLTK